jgi:small subunit ribosomal protein S16
MVTIRLTRRGGKKEPFYHVVVTDSRERQGGRALELVGIFNPVARGKETKLRLDVAKIDAWLKKGAHASERVAALLEQYRREAVAQAETPAAA